MEGGWRGGPGAPPSWVWPVRILSFHSPFQPGGTEQ